MLWDNNRKNTGELDKEKLSYESEFLPNTFIIGAQKSGTTSLANMLAQHSDVCFSSPKEPRFFEYEYPLGIEFYIKKYFGEYKGEKIVGEARTTNMMIPFVPERISEINPNAKIIAILRNPIERAFSAWSHFKDMRPGRETRSVHKALIDGMRNYNPRLWASEAEYVRDLDPMGGPYHGGYIEGGCYWNLIQNWTKFNFDIKLVFLDDLKSDPAAFYSDVCSFLGIDEQSVDFTPKNMTDSWSAFDIWKNERDLYFALEEFYRPDVARLSEFCNRDLITLWGLHNNENAL